jgi:hypothetical protein
MAANPLIYTMITENTGEHFLDSGFENGRMWQRNQLRSEQDFINDPATYIEWDGKYLNRRVSVYHFLSELETDDICDDFNELQDINNDWGSEYFYGVSEASETYLKRILECHIDDVDDFLQNLMPVNTYNHDCDLSQVLQYSMMPLNGEWYVILQIHNGADARGGYTDAKMFQVTSHNDGLLNSWISEYMCDSELYDAIKYCEEPVHDMEGNEIEVDDFLDQYDYDEYGLDFNQVNFGTHTIWYTRPSGREMVAVMSADSLEFIEDYDEGGIVQYSYSRHEVSDVEVLTCKIEGESAETALLDQERIDLINYYKKEYETYLNENESNRI